MKNEKNWKTVLSNYQLMKDSHSENDAQNWHILGFDLVSSSICNRVVCQFNQKFKRSGLKALRLQIKQPSPNWLDSTLKHISCYSKRVDPNAALQQSMDSRPQTSHSQVQTDSFSAFKTKIKSNLKGHNNQNMQGVQEKSCYLHQQHYIEDVRKVELFNKALL